MAGADTDGEILDTIADLVPLLLPGATLHRAAPAVELSWGRGISTSAVVGVADLVDRCRGLPVGRRPEAIRRWLDAVRAEGELATEEHRYGDVAPRQRTVLVPRGYAGRTAGLLAAVVLPFGEHFEVLVMVRTGDSLRPLTIVRRSMLGLAEDGLPSPVQLTLDEIADLSPAPVPGTGLSLLHRAGDVQVSMALADRERLLPSASEGWGLLVGVPRLSMLAYCPAGPGSTVQPTADELARWVMENHVGAPDPCSPDVFWLTTDRLVRLPVTLTEPPSVLLPDALRPRPRTSRPRRSQLWPWRR